MTVADPSEGARETSPFALSPNALATPLLIAFNLAVFVGMLADGMPLQGAPPVEQLVGWGANFGPLTLAGEWWRLIVCTFLHANLFHLVPNLLGLWIGGNLLERRIGSANLLAIYLASAVASSLASLAWHPGLIAFGASGAVLGVLGALAICSFRVPDFVHPAPAISPFTIAVMILVATGLLGFANPAADHAGHVGGLVGGCVMALGLAGPSRVSPKLGPSLRPVALSAVFFLLIFVVAANLPRRIVAVENQFLIFRATQMHLANRFNGARAANDGRGLDLVDFRDLIAEQILPVSREARSRIEMLEDIPEAYEKHRQIVLEASLERERQWQSLVDQFTRVQEALVELARVEEQIAEDYAQIQESQARRVVAAEVIADLLFEYTVDPWENLIQDMRDEAGLTETLRERLEMLRSYAETRQRAWDLFARSVRDDVPDLAAAAQQEHQRAREFISTWVEESAATETSEDQPVLSP